MGSDHYCLRWNNHQNNLLGVFSQLLQEESLVDVTLACSEGHSIRAHKVVLSACSSYFQSLFLDHPSRHPIIILKDVCFNELRTLIEFMYRGEVNIEYCRLPTLLKTAESLQVKGLAEMTHLPPNLSPEMPPGNNQPPPVSAHKEAISLVTRPRRSHSSDDSLENDSGAGCAIRSRPSSIIKSVPPARLPSVPTPVEDRSVSPDPAELEAEADLEDDASSDRSIRQTDDHSDRPFHPFIDPVQDAPLPLVKQELDRATEEISSGETSTDGRRSVSRFHDPIIPTFPFELPPYRDSNSSFIFPLRSTPASPSTTARSGTSTSAPSSGTASSSLTPTSPLSQSSAAYGAPHFFLPPFHLPVLQPRFYPSDSAFSIYSLLQQQLYPAVVPPRYSSPNDLPWATSGAQRTFIKCAICQAAFPNGWLLEQHTILQHRGSSSGGGGGGGTAATQHQATANSRKSNGSAERAGDHKPFQCGQCGQSYRYRSAYVKHREQDHRARLPADKLFTCDICGMQFRYLKSFEKHRLNHSVEVVQPQSTGTANSNAVSAAPTKVEGSSSSSSNSQQRKASSSSSSKLSSLEENMSESQSDNPLTTDYPHQEQEPQQQQQQHEHEHEQEHAISLRRESGASGASSVAATDRLLSESRVSSSNEVDGQAASTSSGSSSTKGGGGGGGESSSAERGLYNILHYPERQRERQQFACSFCSKTVRSKENLKLHVRKHTGERPYACLFCGRAFGGKSDLTRHVRIHTGERPYHCEMCGKCFARADYLSKHLTTHLHNNPRTNAATAD